MRVFIMHILTSTRIVMYSLSRALFALPFLLLIFIGCSNSTSSDEMRQKSKMPIKLFEIMYGNNDNTIACISNSVMDKDGNETMPRCGERLKVDIHGNIYLLDGDRKTFVYSEFHNTMRLLFARKQINWKYCGPNGYLYFPYRNETDNYSKKIVGRIDATGKIKTFENKWEELYLRDNCLRGFDSHFDYECADNNEIESTNILLSNEWIRTKSGDKVWPITYTVSIPATSSGFKKAFNCELHSNEDTILFPRTIWINKSGYIYILVLDMPTSTGRYINGTYMYIYSNSGVVREIISLKKDQHYVLTPEQENMIDVSAQGNKNQAINGNDRVSVYKWAMN